MEVFTGTPFPKVVTLEGVADERCPRICKTRDAKRFQAFFIVGSLTALPASTLASCHSGSGLGGTGGELRRPAGLVYQTVPWRPHTGSQKCYQAKAQARFCLHTSEGADGPCRGPPSTGVSAHRCEHKSNSVPSRLSIHTCCTVTWANASFPKKGLKPKHLSS